MAEMTKDEIIDDLHDALHIAQTEMKRWRARAQKCAKMLGIRDMDIDFLDEGKRREDLDDKA